MTSKCGRPKTFNWSIVPLALEIRERTRRTWPDIARELGVHPGTLRTRAAEYSRLVSLHKTPAMPTDGPSPCPDASRKAKA